MILAVLIDGDGRPVCTEMWPGNTADVGSLIPAVDRLQRRFRINRVCVVADRGMISDDRRTRGARAALRFGRSERADKLVQQLVFDDPAPFVPFVVSKRGNEVDYEAKAVMLAGRRYIVCRKPRSDEEGRRRPRRHRRRAGEAVEEGRQEPHRQTRVFAASSPSPRATAFPSIAPGRGGRQVRRRVRAAHQRLAVAVGGDARLQTIMDRGASVPSVRSRSGSPSRPTPARKQAPDRCAGSRQPSPRRGRARRARGPCRQIAPPSAKAAPTDVFLRKYMAGNRDEVSTALPYT